MNNLIEAIQKGISNALSFNIDNNDSDFSIKKSKIDSANSLTALKLLEEANRLLDNAEYEEVYKLHEEYGATCKPKNTPLLISLMRIFNSKNFDGYDLNWVDVSDLTSLDGVFHCCYHFNCDISKWDVSKVTTLSGTFYKCGIFNLPLNDWDVSNVVYMDSTFYDCTRFNLPINNWNVSNVISMERMFTSCHDFNLPLDKWDVSNVTNMYGMFAHCANFNLPINNWDISKVKNFDKTFYCSGYSQDLSDWIINSNDNVNCAEMFMYSNVTPNNRPLIGDFLYKDKGKLKISREFCNKFNDLQLIFFYNLLKNGSYKGFSINDLTDFIKQYIGTNENKDN